jgi:Family of unknown function (DUF6790)
VGLGAVGFAIVGVTASVFDRDYTLAAIIVYSIFMLGAALGHVRSMIRERNFAPGNAGYIFWYDIFAPAPADHVVRRHRLRRPERRNGSGDRPPARSVEAEPPLPHRPSKRVSARSPSRPAP